MAEDTKTRSVLFPAQKRLKAVSNAAKHPWARGFQEAIIKAAQPWMKLSDDELWNLMFGATIKRSWMVWSNGFCPSCRKDVPMYQWQMDALSVPWKTRCPHCKELFPKNDFYKFYLSGLDEHGVFDPAKADRALLFNSEHPDPKDPIHLFGVDDGDGYVEGDKRWRFVGAYLIYGQWKQAILGGIKSLAMAYAVTGDKSYAHKAGVLLDRVADLYPTFDFKEQGFVYEVPGAAGYVSTWHDACWETQTLALAYDQVFDAIKDDSELQRFLAQKATQYRLDNAKSSFADIQRNIEDRILRDALANRKKIESNFPQTDMAITYIKTILGWPGNRNEVMGLIGDIIKRSTAVDGVTGEKGLSGYACLGPRSLGFFLAVYSAIDPLFLNETLAKYPTIRDCYRFHIDTWCLQGSYYPLVGDCGAFARPTPHYCGLTLLKGPDGGMSVPGPAPSMFTFLWKLYEVSKDPAFVQILYRGNGYSLDGLPYDLFADDPQAFQQSVQQVIDKVGTAIKLGSVNKQQWHLGILRSGDGKNERALWLDYDSGGGHSHFDGMNLGLFALGLDLLPDFGYPPVHYGGWDSPKAKWYTMTAAHNTVVVDAANQTRADGKTTLWADGKEFHAIRASCPEMIRGKQYERTAALIDLSAEDFYVLDIFRVVGGTQHDRFLHSYFGTLSTTGLQLSPTQDYGGGTQMRSFKLDPSPKPGWTADWACRDQYELLPKGSGVALRCFDLTSDAQAMTAEQWVSQRQFDAVEEAWIPALVVRRKGVGAPLASTFVSLLEPYTEKPRLIAVKRLPLAAGDDGTPFSDANVAIEVRLDDGRRDVIIAADVENPLGYKPWFNDAALVQKETRIKLDGEMCFVRFDRSGEVSRIALGRARSVEAGDKVVRLKSPQEFVEVEFGKSGPAVVSGAADSVEITAGR